MVISERHAEQNARAKEAARRFARFAFRLLPLLPIPLVLVVWEVIGRVQLCNPTLFPPPSAVWQALFELAERGWLASDISASLGRAAVGYATGCGVGVMAGVMTGRVSALEKTLGQICHILRAFPPVALVPIAITWFGLAESSKYFLVAWGVFFPVWVSTHSGVTQIDKRYVWAAKSLGATRKGILLEVLLPGALPHVLSGMRVAIGLCFICVFVAEMAGAYEGVGFRISTTYLVFRIDLMLASLIVLGAMGALADQVFKWTAHWLFRWTSLDGA